MINHIDHYCEQAPYIYSIFSNISFARRFNIRLFLLDDSRIIKQYPTCSTSLKISVTTSWYKNKTFLKSGMFFNSTHSITVERNGKQWLWRHDEFFRHSQHASKTIEKDSTQSHSEHNCRLSEGLHLQLFAGPQTGECLTISVAETY